MTTEYWRSAIGLPVSELDTPAVLIDLDVVDRNIARMQSTISSHGVAFRPHVKTHKTPELARRQIAAGAVGITTAKVGEAEVFVDAGIDDVVIAYPVFGEPKWERAALLAHRARMTVHVENEEAVEGWSHAARRAGVELDVRVEIDTGFNRCGVRPDQALSLAGRVERAPRLRLAGITTHRSAFFAHAGRRPLDELGREEGEIMAGIAEDLRGHGVPIATVAGGSSPTSPSFAAVPGVTEACAGTYIFYDEGMRAIGACEPDEIAISMLCTVVSVDGESGRVTVDGGSKTFSKDGYDPSLRQFGRAVDGRSHLAAVTEEHGMVHLHDDAPPPALGEKVRYRPMHVCPVVNLTDALVGTRAGVVEEVFEVAARGRTW